MTSTTAKGDRLAVRMTARQKLTIERAAEVLGRTVTDFSVQVLTERSEEVLSDRHIFGVDKSQWDEFLRQLERPAQPVEELVALLRRRSAFDE